MTALKERNIEADSTCANRTFIKLTQVSSSDNDLDLFVAPTSISEIQEHDGGHATITVSTTRYAVCETVEEVFEMMRQSGITITILEKE